jgi:hypothetical protein
MVFLLSVVDSYDGVLFPDVSSLLSEYYSRLKHLLGCPGLGTEKLSNPFFKFFQTINPNDAY